MITEDFRRGFVSGVRMAMQAMRHADRAIDRDAEITRTCHISIMIEHVTRTIDPSLSIEEFSEKSLEGLSARINGINCVLNRFNGMPIYGPIPIKDDEKGIENE